MAQKALRLLAVGAVRSPHWKAAAAHYLERLGHWRKVHEQVVRDADPRLPEPERIQQEGRALLQAQKDGDYLICLDERGKSMSSRDFAAFLQRIFEQTPHTPCFILGGAFGLSSEVRDSTRTMLALGPMTLPHELARVVLLEQLYRAESILRKSQYHH